MKRKGLIKKCCKDSLISLKRTQQSNPTVFVVPSGEAPFFGGDRPSSADCAIFGQLAQLRWNAPGSKYEALVTGKGNSVTDSFAFSISYSYEREREKDSQK